MWRFVLAAVLGPMVGATGPADAGVTYIYSMNAHLCTQNTLTCGYIDGSFSVDSANFNATGITDISSFLNYYDFTVTAEEGSEAPFATGDFDPASGFLPSGVSVTPAGVLAGGSIATPDTDANAYELSIGTGAEISVPIAFSCCAEDAFVVLNGVGDWTTTTSPLPMPAPEPATWVLISAGALMLLAHARRLRARLPKIARTV